ncbi:hypothetical protein M8A51_19465 [Schlegelella sp. S2-27]|uniref:Zinc-ribbon domain-containing protein n=1 Tax=Caldimonas mangrovi TaxID=2944811 RepID=A0ABT0YSJ7_9BURK|nr:hypothetical protein [Caldimonas mangrovi]MCM5681711.1 hypothetical protein [Caldimonas mangrovi]
MSTPFNFSPSGPYSLMRIGEAWRNRPGLLTLLCTFVGMAVLFGIGFATGVPVLVALFMLAGYVLMLLGTVTAGHQFMDQAQGRPITPTLPAFTASPMVVLRMLGLLLILGAALLVWFLAAAVLLYLCKIPGIGGLLLIVVLPVLTFTGALLFLGLYVAWALSAPALFEGHSLKRALSQLWAVASQRPLEAFLHLVLLFLVVGFVAMLVGGFVGMGFMASAGLSASILDGMPFGGMGSMMNGMDGYGAVGPSVSVMYGGMIGAGIVWAVVGAVFGALMLYGLCLTYLKLTSGLNVEAAEAALDTALAKTREKAQQAADEARRRAQEVQEAARQRAEQARKAEPSATTAPAAAAAPAPAPPSAPAAEERTVIMPSPAAPAAPVTGNAAQLACPSCHSPISPNDVFCGSCGHKLK